MARKRYADLDRSLLLRAVKLARLPGVKRGEACERFDLSIGMLRRAMKELALEAIPSRRDLVMHALTDAGTRRSGKLGDLSMVASYLDYVNKDGSTAEQIRSLIDELVADGALALDGERWTLSKDFP